MTCLQPHRILAVAVLLGSLMIPIKLAADGCAFPKELHVIRVDATEKRLFIEGTEGSVSSRSTVTSRLRKLNKVIRVCEPTWKGRWSASFFSDPKLAGYKTDPDLSNAVSNGTWGRAYIAEYDSATQTLTVFPLDPVKRRTLNIVVDR